MSWSDALELLCMTLKFLGTFILIVAVIWNIGYIGKCKTNDERKNIVLELIWSLCLLIIFITMKINIY